MSAEWRDALVKTTRVVVRFLVFFPLHRREFPIQPRTPMIPIDVSDDLLQKTNIILQRMQAIV